MTGFTIDYTSSAQPFDHDGTQQERTLHGRIDLPANGQPPFPVVVIAHGYTSFMDWGFFPPLVSALAERGYASLRFNFSGSGIGPDLVTMTRPEVFRKNSYLHELADLHLLRDRLRSGFWPELDPSRCSLLGHSRGAAMGIVHAAEDGGYETVISWAGMDSILQFTHERLRLWEEQGELDVMHWTARRRLPLDVATLHAARADADRLDILAACRRLRCRLLVVMGDADRSLPFAVAERLRAAAGDRGTLCRIPGGDHTFGARHPIQEPLPGPLEEALDVTLRHAVEVADRRR